jgi:hypothetical protein
MVAQLVHTISWSFPTARDGVEAGLEKAESRAALSMSKPS